MFDDGSRAELFAYIEKFFIPRVSSNHLDMALNLRQGEVSYHPVRNYLEECLKVWDGKERLDTMLRVYCGALGPEKYLAAIGKFWMVAGCARIFRPGSKHDSMLILEGPQELGKSEFFRILASDEWFSDSLISNLGSKDSMTQLEGTWIAELAELSAFGKTDPKTSKGVLSQRFVKVRKSYRRDEEILFRTTVFCGTSNDDSYLQDRTGNRRYWPARCTRIDLDKLKKDRNQLWGEALNEYRKGGDFYITDPEVRKLAEEEQMKRVPDDPNSTAVLRVLKGEYPDVIDTEEMRNPGISVGDIMDALEVPVASRRGNASESFRNILRDEGFVKSDRVHSKNKRTLWIAPEGYHDEA